ncbi:MAG: helix-turn-helix domain-containing protein [Lachnospiraceae bacterium]|nr:helix-turn-helix domain-containing protein [Lachnospiraceae bacterium]
MFTSRDQQEIGKRIRELRRSINETQLQFSEAVGITPNYLSELENGKKGLSCSTLFNICENRKVSADYLLFGEDTDPVPPSETIISYATKMNTHDLSILITYLQSLLKMKEMK